MLRQQTYRTFILLLTLTLCGLPELAAQSAAPFPDAPSKVRLIAQNTTSQDPNAAPATQQSEQQAPAEPRVVPVDPQAAPGTEAQPSFQGAEQNEPVRALPPADPAELEQLESAQKQNQPAAAPVNDRINPLGAAAAEKARTAGGGASRPAGVAIAPAKQKRSRALWIKLGAAAAAGAAVGAVYALTRGTNSVPAGAQR